MGQTVPKAGEQLHTAQKRQSLLEQITAYVDANLSETLTLKQVSAHFGVSVSTVTQAFQKNTETTFHQFVTDRRIEKALCLIRQGKALESVGREVGYRDHSTFYRAFCQKCGISPREYRKTILSDTNR